MIRTSPLKGGGGGGGGGVPSTVRRNIIMMTSINKRQTTVVPTPSDVYPDHLSLQTKVGDRKEVTRISVMSSIFFSKNI